MRDLIGVVIPALQEARAIEAALDHLAALPGDWDVVVADGGSRDGTAQIARAHPRVTLVLEVRGGRAAQINAGAHAVAGDPVVFLHVDSRLPASAHASLRAAARTHVGGNFALRFDGDDGFAWLLGRIYALQRLWGVYYGDSTIWVRRDAWARLGGCRELEIMDDHDLARRIERLGPTACLPGPATTSDRRWRNQGIARTALSWMVIRYLYLAGVSPARLAGLYRRIR